MGEAYSTHERDDSYNILIGEARKENITWKILAQIGVKKMGMCRYEQNSTG
jgi:hypothetical protein